MKQPFHLLVAVHSTLSSAARRLQIFRNVASLAAISAFLAQRPSETARWRPKDLRLCRAHSRSAATTSYGRVQTVVTLLGPAEATASRLVQWLLRVCVRSVDECETAGSLIPGTA